MLNKTIVVLTIIIIVIKIAISPIITKYAYEKSLQSLYFISYFFSFLLVILISISVVQIKKCVSKEVPLRNKDETAKKNIYNHLILPLFLILLAIYLSFAIGALIGLPYHGKPARLTPIYHTFLPFFFATLIMGIIFGKKGWILGFFASCLRINLNFLSSYILYSSWHRMTTFEFIGFVTRSYQYHSFLIIRDLVAGTLGGFLGGLMRHQIDLMKLPEAMFVKTKKRISIFSLSVLIFIVLCLVGGSVIYSQFVISKIKDWPYCQWGKTFEGRCISFQPTKDGGFIFVGNVDQPKMKYGYLMKIDSQGDTVWNKKYDGVILRMAQETADRKYIVTGSKKVADNEDDILLIKADSIGNIIWEKSYGGEYSDYGISVIETSAGDFVIAGVSAPNGTILIKTDNEGNSVWQRAYWSNNSLGKCAFFGYSILETSDKGYIISASPSDKIQLLKVNENGEYEWTSMFLCESYNGNASSVVNTFDDCYAITGYFFGESLTDDVCLVKVDKHGDRIWRKTYGEKGMDFGYDVKQTPDSGFIIVGTTTQIRSYRKYTPQFIKRLCSKYTFVAEFLFDGTSGIWTDLYVLKTDRKGNELWKREFYGIGSAEPEEDCLHEDYSYYFIQNTMDGGYIIAGEPSCCGLRYIDFYVHKLK